MYCSCTSQLFVQNLLSSNLWVVCHWLQFGSDHIFDTIYPMNNFLSIVIFLVLDILKYQEWWYTWLDSLEGYSIFFSNFYVHLSHCSVISCILRNYVHRTYFVKGLLVEVAEKKWTFCYMQRRLIYFFSSLAKCKHFYYSHIYNIIFLRFMLVSIYMRFFSQFVRRTVHINSSDQEYRIYLKPVIRSSKFFTGQIYKRNE